MSDEESNYKLKKWDLSLTIAFIAVLISSLSAFISFKESKLMMEQQRLLTSQQEASVWPYLQNTPYNEYQGDSVGVFTYVITNKGIGPAIIDDVKYTFDSTEIEPWGLGTELRKRYGEHVSITQTQNASLNKNVLAPGETHKVVTEKITIIHQDSTNLNEILNEIGRLYVLEYCYCSVYGKCWFVKGWDEVSQSEKCEFRKDIR